MIGWVEKNMGTKMQDPEVADIEEEPVPPKPRGRPRKLPEPEPVVQDEEPAPKAKGRPRKPRDPSQMEPARVTIQTARGERSFDAFRPKRAAPPEPPPQPPQPPQQQPQPERGRFWAMHHKPSHRQQALQSLMASW